MRGREADDRVSGRSGCSGEDGVPIGTARGGRMPAAPRHGPLHDLATHRKRALAATASRARREPYLEYER